MPPDIDGFDHIHVYVADRPAAERWYARVLGFVRAPDLAFWSPDGGPLTIQNAGGTVHLALFERPPQSNRSVVALRTGAEALAEWLRHLRAELGDSVTVADHDVSVSLYFRDPDGNPYEITTYEYAAAKHLTMPGMHADP